VAERFDEKNLFPWKKSQERPSKPEVGWSLPSKRKPIILNLEKETLNWARKNCSPYLAEYGEHISTWRIERVIRKYNSIRLS